MGIKETLQKVFHKDERMKELQHEAKIQRIVQERMKSSNERELEKYLEQKRQENIKKQLDVIHKQQQKEWWTGHSILKQDKSILHEDTNILKQPNIFSIESTMFKQKGMFFK